MNPYPLDAQLVPRFAGIATFYRLPYVETAQGLDVPVIGLPFDTGTSFRPGARFGPRAVREASSLLRPYNPVIGVDPYKILRVADVGDLPLNPMNMEVSFRLIEEKFRQFAKEGMIPLTIGGDHSITYPLVKGLCGGRVRPGLLHFDAHLDTWDSYFGSKFTHGSFAIRLIEDELIDTARSIQVGIRGPLFGPEDLERCLRWKLRSLPMDRIVSISVDEAAAEIKDVVGEGPVYLTFDIDAVDPAFAPGTGTPEAGGLTSAQAIAILQRLKGIEFIGADIVEVAPSYDSQQVTAFLAARLGLEIISLIAYRRAGGAGLGR